MSYVHRHPYTAKQAGEIAWVGMSMNLRHIDDIKNKKSSLIFALREKKNKLFLS